MLLAIDTCGVTGGVALGDSGPASSTMRFRELAGKTYSELLLTTIDELLREAGVEPAGLSGLVVVNGPGSFTGIRIGVSAAKGLSEGLELPVIAISRLELLARQALGGNAVAVLDAGRHEFYAGLYRRSVRESEALFTRAELLQEVENSGLPVVICEQQLLPALELLCPVLAATPTAVDVLRIGGERYRAGIFEDVSSFEANYLRRSENEMLARIAEHAAARQAKNAKLAE